jgi:hypothetical protein
VGEGRGEGELGEWASVGEVGGVRVGCRCLTKKIVFNKKNKKEVEKKFLWTPPSGLKSLYIGRGWEWGWEEQKMSGSWCMEWKEQMRAIALKEVLCKYGLEKDQEVLRVMGVADVGDIAWMSAEEMMDARLTGSFEQYVAMQEGEFAEVDEGVREAQPSDFGPQ